jgi:nucleotide-binding universal stress UspA family protein
MTTLVPVDGSQSSLEALKYAARRRPTGDLLIVHVAPSGRQSDLERGRFLLEDSARACRVIAQNLRVETRLEVGDPRAKLQEVASDAGADLVVMGAHGMNDLPHLDHLGREASEVTGDLQQPVVLVLPTGKGIRFQSHGTESEVEDEALVAS